MEQGQKIMETSRDNFSFFFFFFFGWTHFSCWFTNVIKMTIVKHFKTNRISFLFFFLDGFYGSEWSFCWEKFSIATRDTSRYLSEFL